MTVIRCRTWVDYDRELDEYVISVLVETRRGYEGTREYGYATRAEAEADAPLVARRLREELRRAA